MNLPTGKKSVRVSANNKIQVQMGDICCSITCDDEEIYSQLREQYINFLSDKPADISFNFEIVNRMSFEQVKAAIPRMDFRREGKRFVATNLTCEGEFDAERATFSATLEKNLFKPGHELKMMNHLLPMAYFTVCEAKHGGRPPAMPVHSCGILRDGHALLFAGPYDTGKTTVARLCGTEHGQVLNDEMMLLSRSDQRSGVVWAGGLPIIGGVDQRLNMVAPLRSILLLKQSQRTGVRCLSKMEAHLRFLRQLITPRQLGTVKTRIIVSLLSEFSSEIVSTIPFFELEFKLDRELLWEVVGELETSLLKEGARCQAG